MSLGTFDDPARDPWPYDWEHLPEDVAAGDRSG